MFCVFRLRSTLNKHLKAHANYKPHECKECGERFSRTAYLEAHMYKHSGACLFETVKTSWVYIYASVHNN